MAVKHTQLHYAADKYQNTWYRKVANLVVTNGGCRSLLQGKNVQEIDNYANGIINMKPFEKAFKSRQRELTNQQKNGETSNFDTPDNIFIPLPLIVVKYNTAVEIVSKTGFDIAVKATDAAAQRKRDRDIKYLKARPKVQAIEQDIADMLDQGETEAAGTENSSMEFKEPPFGLDLNNPSDLKLMNMIYKLRAEASYEFALDKIYEFKRIDEVDYLETKDDFRFGVRSNNVLINGTTSIPEVEYLYPGNVFVPRSFYPDHRDIPYGYIVHNMTIQELGDNFGNDFGNVPLSVVINGEGKVTAGSYIDGNNNGRAIQQSEFDTHKIEVYEVQFRTIDHMPVVKDENDNYILSKEESDENVFGQNTVKFFWIKGTNYFFKKEKLGFAYRKSGQDAFTNFTWNIYKCQEKSAVEHCIGENRAAQIAYIKMLYAVVKSAPNGKYIDLAYINNAVEQMDFNDGGSAPEKAKELIDLAIEHNIMIGSSAGFDGQAQGQFLPFREIAGGLKGDIEGFMRVMINASVNISRFTGINDELAGLNNNPDLLNGARQMNITQGMNAINYSYRAKQSNYSAVFNVISWYIKDAIESGGLKKKAFEEFIGTDRVNNISDFGTIKGHTFYNKISLGMRQEEMQSLNENIQRLEQLGKLSRMDRLIIDQTKNLKEAGELLATAEFKKEKQMQANQEAQMQNQQQLEQMRTQGLGQIEQLKTEGKIQQIGAQANASATLMQLSAKIGLTEEQTRAVLKNQLQDRRLQAQQYKADSTLQAKKELKQQDLVAPLM